MLKKVVCYGVIVRVCSKIFFVEEIESNRRKINIRWKGRFRLFVEELFVKKLVVGMRYKVLIWMYFKYCSKLFYVILRFFFRLYFKDNIF